MQYVVRCIGLLCVNKMKKIKNDGKVSAIICFYNQNENIKSVVNSIEHQVDEVIVVKDKGCLTTQRNIGLEKAKHEYILFCDGDIIVRDGFVANAVAIMTKEEKIGMIGGKIITPCLSPAQELMCILRLRSFYKEASIAGSFMTRRKYFLLGAKFNFFPYENKGLTDWLKTYNLYSKRIDVELVHIGEPLTITKLLQRQCKYGTVKDYSILKHALFDATPFGPFIFYLYYPYYNELKKKGMIITDFFKLAELFNTFMSTYYNAAYHKYILEGKK